jgi:hypothetical protein
MNQPESLRNCNRIRQSIRGDCLASTHADCDIVCSQDSETILVSSIISGEKNRGATEASPGLVNSVALGCLLGGALDDPVTCPHDQISTPRITHLVGGRFSISGYLFFDSSGVESKTKRFLFKPGAGVRFNHS